jgi:hypothetical protein
LLLSLIFGGDISLEMESGLAIIGLIRVKKHQVAVGLLVV